MLKQKRYNYLYVTTNIVTGKIYVGVHSTNNLNDGYIGSGVKLKDDIEIYGKENFRNNIIKFFDNLEDAYLVESFIVDKEFVQREDTYNSHWGGSGGDRFSDEGLERMREKHRKRKEKVYKISAELRDMMAQDLRTKGKYSDETKHLMSVEMKVVMREYWGWDAKKHNKKKNESKYSKELRTMMSVEMKEMGRFTEETRRMMREEEKLYLIKCRKEIRKQKRKLREQEQKGNGSGR